MHPSTVEELRDAIAGTGKTHPRLLVAGTGTATSWGAPAAPADAIIDTTKSTGVLRYNPADMTIAVRAGTPLVAIQQVLAEHHQRVAFDPARAARGATVGGLLATADAGPLRTGYGSLRDLVIGVTVVLSDGTVARSGGHVIKNVAGYDLAKLFHGSLGTLGVVAEVVLRLHPLPRATSTVAVEGSAEDAFAVTGKVVEAGLEAAALEWCDGRLLVKLEGTPDGVTERAGAVCAIAADAQVLSEDEADRAWAGVAATAEGGSGSTVLRIGTLPTAGPRAVGKILALAGESGIAARVSSSVQIGVHTVHLSGGAHDELLSLAQQEFGAAVTVHRRDGLGPSSGWGPPPPAVRVMRAIKRQFDPAGRFGAGRFAPWLDDEEHPS
ncbi:FAD-binding protein [Amycolatopsis alkalitolerans]|uniref:FAD-binding protein n=2 Tax=Amycolatopsis alkalitolerans TaxID=2547244 RepID=A0A5C4MCI4_9PSEU|nr:FAD-binding protein [Amycolatopsis alkalitolerans]